MILFAITLSAAAATLAAGHSGRGGGGFRSGYMVGGFGQQ
jgi:hypothetical protein